MCTALVLLALVGPAQDPDSPFSPYVNPGSGATPPNLQEPGGDGVRNYGETRIDANPLVDWDVFPAFLGQHPTATLIDPWTPDPTPVPSMLDTMPGKNWWYERAYWELESGCRVVVFRPRENTQDPNLAWPPTSSCPGDGYHRDALFIVQGTKGDPYLPQEWEIPQVVYEIDVEDGFLAIQPGLPGYEAMGLGQTILALFHTLGRHPFFWTFSQIVEAERFLNSTVYSAGSGSTHPNIEHRCFAFGGSYGGVVCINLALWFPWLFKGVIAGNVSPDNRQAFAFHDVSILYSQFLSNTYDSWNDYASLVQLPINLYDNMAFDDLTAGWSGQSVVGEWNGEVWEDYPVDRSGLSLITSDYLVGDPLANPPVPLAPYHQVQRLESHLTPLILVRGRDDSAFLSFFPEELELLSPSGLIWSPMVDAYRHGGVEFRDWNLINSSYVRLMDMAAGNCGLATPSPEVIEWGTPVLGAVDPDGVPLLHRSVQFNTLVERPPGGLALPFATEPGFDQFQVYEGLGANRSTIAGDLRTDTNEPANSFELLSSTIRGEVVMLRVSRAPAQFLPQVDELWQTPISSEFGNCELILEQGHVFALHRNGPFSVLDLEGKILYKLHEVDDEENAGLPAPLETQLRQLRLLDDEPSFVFVDNAGNLVVVGASAQGQDPFKPAGLRRRLEHAVGQLLPLPGTTELIYSCSHGNLKRYDVLNPEAPVELSDLSEHLSTYVRTLLEVPAGSFGSLRYLGLDNAPDRNETFDPDGPPLPQSQLFAFDQDLEYLTDASMEVPGSTDGKPIAYRDVRVDGSSATSGVLRLVAHTSFALHWLELDPASLAVLDHGTAKLPNAVASVVELETPFTFVHVDEGGLQQVVDAEYVLTLHSGEIAFVGGLFISGTEPLVQVAGKPYGAAYGLIPNGGSQIVVGKRGNVWEIDPLDGTILDSLEPGTVGADPDPPPIAPPGGPGIFTDAGAAVVPAAGGHPLENLFHGVPNHGAAKASGGVLGFPDGGDVLDGSSWLAWMAESTPDVPGHDDLAGRVVVVQLQGDGSFPLDPSLTFEHLEEVYPELLAGYPSGTTLQDLFDANAGLEAEVASYFPEFHWRCDPPISSTNPEFGGHSVRWTRVDGDAATDLVVGTSGGRVVWFKNSGTDLLPTFDPAITGEYVPLPGEALAPVLGHRVIAMDVGDLDGDGPDDQEIVVGTLVEHRADSISELLLRGGVTVLDLIPGGLDLVPLGMPGTGGVSSYSLPDGEGGIYGLHLTDLSLGGGLRDILASTMCGRLYVLRFEPIPAPGSVSLLGSYQFLAPGLGAYNAIQSLPNPGAFGGQGGTRVILCSANGIHALDLPRVSTGLLLTSSHDSISASAGGSVTLSVSAGIEHAEDTYFVLGSTSGTGIGVPLGDLVLPLDLDEYLGFTLAYPNSGPLEDTLGTLAFDGTATAAIHIPPGLDLGETTVHHAYVVISVSDTGVPFLSLVSNAVPLSVVP